ncbi:MAG: glycoside hydrolase/phage tail family protein [Henriciella sp.]|nr:glycoside hydrolase/phage tail family protein [Henriciella sp.]
MAQIVLSQVGAVAGRALLPQGISVLGQTVAGSTIGRFAGSLAGRAIDAALAPDMEGPRIASLHITESREGAGFPLVYGRMRVGGQVIWAARFKEKREESSAGKGGPSFANYTYSVSFAVALCQGPITRIDRVWANGELLTLSDYNWRLYSGDEDQLPDPLIEAIEGSGHAPAYRGVAYIVFEDLPLDRFGNRLPQLSFEVVRAGREQPDALRGLVRGVNIIPASGEFVYGTQIVRERRFPGIETPLNMNNHDGRSDFLVSLDQLRSDLPLAKSSALTVAWFGDDIRAGYCKIRPGVETRERSTVPYQWSVDGVGRGSAYLISSTDDAANYGGTPADLSVLEGISALKAAGQSVTLSPFLLMDIPAGNGLPNPDGVGEQPTFPWRGRITVSSDKTAGARDEVDAFVGTDGSFGFRHFILHHARLAAQAGGVDAFLIGSEMFALTRVRDDQNRFPFVEALIDIASEARAILGPNVKISYAADWTEYGTYAPEDGSNDVWFPLDPLWASSDLDFVGVDWYPPAGDWRDGDAHLDALAGYNASDDADYLLANMHGGEAFDWYYANEADRDAQVRTPIADTAHNEHWVFRPKDLSSWWSETHHPRPQGVRSSQPTLWIPSSKPVRLIEIGFPALDRGGNAPNLFYDPKSSESALPPYSKGLRDDLYQRRALVAALTYWQAQPCVEQALVWAWDGRPWPHFPSQDSVWSDGPNWPFGHWLNGRSGLIELSEVVEDLAGRAGLTVDASRLQGFVEGLVQPGISDLRSALSPLEIAFELSCIERESGLIFQHRSDGDTISIANGDWVEDELSLKRGLLDKAPGQLQLTYLSGEANYDTSLVEARRDGADPRESLRMSLPMVFSAARAQDIAESILEASLATDTATVSTPPTSLNWEADDRVELTDGSIWKVSDISARDLVRSFELVPDIQSGLRVRASTPNPSQTTVSLSAVPELVLIDGPQLVEREPGLLVAATSSPWPGSVTLTAGGDVASLIERAVFDAPADIGKLLSPLASGPIGRWDGGSTVTVEIPGADLASLSRNAVLNGAGLLLVEGASHWELLAFRDAELIGPDQWRLRGLLRGLRGGPVVSAEIGQRMVVVDGRVLTIPISDTEVGLELLWQAGTAEPVSHVHLNRAGLPWRVGHLRARQDEQGTIITWTRRGSDVSDSWYPAEASNVGTYRVEALSEGVLVSSEDVDVAAYTASEGCDEVRVAEIGTDTRLGEWASIPL